MKYVVCPKVFAVMAANDVFEGLNVSFSKIDYSQFVELTDKSHIPSFTMTVGLGLGNLCEEQPIGVYPGMDTEGLPLEYQFSLSSGDQVIIVKHGGQPCTVVTIM